MGTGKLYDISVTYFQYKAQMQIEPMLDYTSLNVYN